jgi:hypothetical protein
MFQSLAEFAAHLRACLASPATWDDATFNRLALDLFALQFAGNAPFRRLCEAVGQASRRFLTASGNEPGTGSLLAGGSLHQRRQGNEDGDRRDAHPTPSDAPQPGVPLAGQGLRHWSAIPAVPTSAFKDLELTCLLPTERRRVFHSSGTTGQTPSRHFHSPDSLALYEASLRPWFERHLRADGFRGRCLVLTPPPSEAPHSSLVHMLGTVAAGEGGARFLAGVATDGSWHLDASQASAELAQSCAAKEPVLLAGTAFSFVHLLDHLSGKGCRFALPAGSRVMETGGYKGRSRSLPKEELHRLITDRLGVPPDGIVCEYGMSELSSQAYDHVADTPRGGSGVFVFPPWARARVISPETGREVAEGETGLLRVVDLANAFSVLAVQTEDLAVRRGAGFELLGRAERAEPRGCSLLPAEGAGTFWP